MDEKTEVIDSMEEAAGNEEHVAKVLETEETNEEQEEGAIGNVCAAMASIMSGLSVRVHVAGSALHGPAYNASEKKPVHGQVARLRKEDQQLMEDVCTDACGCCCGGAAGSGGCCCTGGMTSPCRRRLLHHIAAANLEHCRMPQLDVLLDTDMNHQSAPCSSSSSGSVSGGGVASNVSTPRASTPSPLGIRTRSWSTAAADAAWDSAASISRTISSSF